MKTLKYIVFSIVAVALAAAFSVRADDSKTANPYFAALSKATAVELPAKSAELVAKAEAKTRGQTAVEVVRASVPLNPAAAPAIVSSIAQSSPEVAAIAAATAVSLVPDEAIAIARSAAAAAPGQAAQIVGNVCRLLPENYKKIADAVAEVVPGAGKEILAAIGTAIPALKDSINQVLAGCKGNIPSVSSVLEQVKPDQLAMVATPAVLSLTTHSSSPVVKPPYVPLPVTINNINPGTGGQVPAGGRNYAAP